MSVTTWTKAGVGALLLIASVAAGATAGAESRDAANANRPRANLLEPFTAHYEISRGSLTLGKATFSLNVTNELGCYVYSGHAKPNLLAQLFVGEITQNARFCIVDGRVRPQVFKRHVAGDKEESYTLRFDWSENAIYYENEAGETKTMEFTGRPLDPLSLQIAVRRWLGHAANPAELETRAYTLVDEDDIESFTARVKGAREISLPAGSFETLLVTETGTDEPLQFWLARDAHRVPVRVTKSSGGGSFQLRMQRLVIDGRVIE